jgi:1-acyl-sn-glycerol-3-phosphate acyltransferase
MNKNYKNINNINKIDIIKLEKKTSHDNCIVNHVCHCNNFFYNKDKIVILLPCNHLIHERCISNHILNNKKNCPICDVIFTKILLESKLLNSRYYQNKIDLKSIRLNENLSHINYFSLPISTIKFTSILNKLLTAQTQDEIYSFIEYFFRLFNFKINLIDNTKNNPIIFKNNIVKWKNKVDEDSNIVIISNHTNYLDSIVLMYLFKAGFVASDFINKSDLGKNIINKCNLLVFKRGKDTNMVEKIKEYLNINKRIVIFPEGGMSNNETLFRFRTGAFYTGGVICPVIIKYNPFVWDDNFKKNIFKVISQDEINIDVYINDLFYPPFTNDKIEEVRNYMAEIGNLEKSRVSNKFYKD